MTTAEITKRSQCYWNYFLLKGLYREVDLLAFSKECSKKSNNVRWTTLERQLKHFKANDMKCCVLHCVLVPKKGKCWKGLNKVWTLGIYQVIPYCRIASFQGEGLRYRVLEPLNQISNHSSRPPKWALIMNGIFSSLKVMNEIIFLFKAHHSVF